MPRATSTPSARALSCGIVVVAPGPEVLLCHVTGQRHWDLPKGGIHAGETPLEAARRETAEECGLVFGAAALVELGRFAYTARKELHLFAAASPRVAPASLFCASTFVERGSGRARPEMDGFDWVPPARLQALCTPSMAAVLGALDWPAIGASLAARARHALHGTHATHGTRASLEPLAA